MDLVTQKPVKRYSPPYWWRLIATAASFTLFGIGGVLLRILVFPVLALLPGDAATHRRRARRVVSICLLYTSPSPRD